MKVQADGWIDIARREPGPAWKVYPGRQSGEFVVPHSYEGYHGPGARVFDPAAQASWTGTILQSGELAQHYPVWAPVWASGNGNINRRCSAWEFEGTNAEPWTDAQLATGLALVTALGDFYGREYRRVPWLTPRIPAPSLPAPSGWILEHNEVADWEGDGGTRCPSGRNSRLYAALEGDSMSTQSERLDAIELALVNVATIIAGPDDGRRLTLTEGYALLADLERNDWIARLGLARTQEDVSKLGALVEGLLSGATALPALADRVAGNEVAIRDLRDVVQALSPVGPGMTNAQIATALERVLNALRQGGGD